MYLCYLSDEAVLLLEKKANEIRQSIIEMLIAAESGHTAGHLDIADVLTLLSFYVLRHKPAESDWSERNCLILCNCHMCPVLYATMSHAGYFPKRWFKLKRYNKFSPQQSYGENFIERVGNLLFSFILYYPFNCFIAVTQSSM